MDSVDWYPEMKDRPTNWYRFILSQSLGKERTKKGKMIIHEETHEVETPTGPMRVRLFKPRCGDEKGSAPTSSHAALACLPPALYSGAPLSRSRLDAPYFHWLAEEPLSVETCHVTTPRPRSRNHTNICLLHPRCARRLFGHVGRRHRPCRNM